MRPILKGQLLEEREGKLTWKGVWGMNEIDLGNENLASPFRYERVDLETCKQNEAPTSEDTSFERLLRDGTYSGYFIVRSETGESRFYERNVELRFSPANSGKTNVMAVTGEGSNKIGKFSLSGTFSPDTNELVVIRDYTGDKRNARVRSAARLQSEFDSLPPTMPRSSQNLSTQVDVGKARIEARLVEQLLCVLDMLAELDAQNWFTIPVDAAALGLLDYNSIINNPMDLGTIRNRYLKSFYSSADDIRADIELTFSNAIHYNPRGHPVYKKALELQKVFEDKYNELVTEHQKKLNGTTSGTSNSTDKRPDDIPMSGRIGKRHSIPKTFFEPNQEKLVSPRRRLVEEGPHLPAFPVRRRSLESEHKKKKLKKGALKDDISALRKQVMHMSKTLATYRTVIPNPSALLPHDHSLSTQLNSTFSKKVVSTDEIVKLAREVQNLDTDGLLVVVEVIMGSGYKVHIDEEDQVELDFEELDYDTIQKLKKVCREYQ